MRRINYPLEERICEECGLRPPLDLSVKFKGVVLNHEIQWCSKKEKYICFRCWNGWPKDFAK